MKRSSQSAVVIDALEGRCLLSAAADLQFLHAMVPASNQGAIVQTLTKTATPNVIGTWKGFATIATYKNLPVTMKITSQAGGKIIGTLTITGFGSIPLNNKVTYSGAKGFTTTISKTGITGTLKGQLVTAKKVTGTISVKYAGQTLPGTFTLNKA